MPKTPSYRQRTGYTQAIVTLTDAVTKRRKDFWLGEYGSTASRESYHRIVAEWEANGRRWPRIDMGQPTETNDGAKLKVIITAYWRWAKGYYRDKHVQSLRGALRVLRKYYGDTPATDFGPNKLRLLRDEMVRGDANDDPPRKPWCRKYINAQVQRIRHMFKWAAARELVDASVHLSLRSLEPLRRGSSGVRESAKVEPVRQDLLDGTLPHLSKPVRAVVELQLLTGARPGELLGLRPIDIEIDEPAGVWTYRPELHKNAHREQERIIYFGPRAQAVLRPFLTDRPTDACMFSPREAEAERLAALHANRKTPIAYGNRPGTNRQDEPRHRPGERFTTPAYHQSIRNACDRAFPPTGVLARHDGESQKAWLARLEEAGLVDELNAWRRAHRWHPNQLRHSAATMLRREFGLEAAQLALGHASAQVTDAVYAQRDMAKVIDIIMKVG